jgi:G8 domain/RTX calcium-binding nonapeptide repeat (4 copies)
MDLHTTLPNTTPMHQNHEEDHPVMHDDPKKAHEHMMMLELVPLSQVTHIAVHSGSWFDPHTWKDGIIPDDGAHVLISKDVDVTYDALSTTRVQTVRVDGDLSFSTTKDTSLIVDTLVVNASGALTIGTEDAPMQSGVNAEIIIANNGRIDLDYDPTMLSRGIITHGSVSMHGEEKLVHTKVAVAAKAGDTTLTLAETPTNWAVGDVLVLAATEYNRKSDDTQDEVLTIAGIEGNVVTLSKPLEYNHITPRADLFASVANYSRNITIRSEDADVPVNERGHVMFMHNDDVNVQYVAFNDLGRTDKSRNITDYEVKKTPKGDQILERVVDADGHTILKNAKEWHEGGLGYDDLNIRGRYGVHLHKTGIDSGHGAYLEGNAMMGSPGWGFVQHDSTADMINNAAYDVYGAGFASETGNEIGTWADNISIKNIGRDTKVKEGFGNHDTGGQGFGFWLQSRLIAVNDNISASASQSGFAWFSMGADMMNAPSEHLLNPAVAQSSTIDSEMQNMVSNARNETFASGQGMLSVRNKSFQGHDDRNIIEDFTAWNVDVGLDISYSSKYTVHNLDVLGNGIKDGVMLGGFTEDVVLVNPKIDGFTDGVHYAKFGNVLPKGEKDQYYFTLINPEFGAKINTQVNNFNPARDKILTHNELSSAELNLKIDDASLVAKWMFKGDYIGFSPKGIKTDSLGEVKFPAGSETFAYNFVQTARHIIDNGYWTLKDGTEVTVFEMLISDRVTGIAKTFKFLVTLDKGYVSFAKQYNGNINDFYRGDYTHYEDVYMAANIKSSLIPHKSAYGESFYLAGKHLDDMLKGSAYDDHIIGNGGDDTIEGKGGNDVVIGGSGADVFRIMSNYAATMKIDDFDVHHDKIDATGFDTLTFVQYDHDLIIHLSDKKTMILHDVTFEALSNDNFIGVTLPSSATRILGDYTFVPVAFEIEKDNVVLLPPAEEPESIPLPNTNLIEGTDVKELLYGTSGDDRIFGYGGADSIFGGEGNDTIYGGTGFDKIWGNEGADIFILTPNDDTVGDMLRDFNVGQGDKLDISALLLGYDAGIDKISDFVRVTKQAGHSMVYVNKDGLGNDFVEVAFISNGAALAHDVHFSFLML